MGLQLSQDQIPLKSETKLERKKVRDAALTVVELAGYDPDAARPVLEALGLLGVPAASEVVALVPCTTKRYRLRHLSDSLAGTSVGVRGLSGVAICRGPYDTRLEVFDQEFMDRELCTGRAPRVPIIELPACKKCEAKAAKLTGRDE